MPKQTATTITVNNREFNFGKDDMDCFANATNEEIAAAFMALLKARTPESDLNHLAAKAHSVATAHGWWDSPSEFGTIIALCHSELSEALEEYRAGNPEVYFVRNGEKISDLSQWRGEKLDGEITELADCIIRILDFCGHRKVDIAKIVELKMQYNAGRSYRHGGKKC